MGVLNFIINEVPGQGAIFIVLTACIRLTLQKKSFSETIRGIVMIATGFFILSTGAGLITGSSVDDISTTFNTIMPQAVEPRTVDVDTTYGTEIGTVMIITFAISLLIACSTCWKSIFLIGYMLYWFPYVFIAAGADTDLTGGGLIVLTAALIALYMVVSPNLMRPFVKKIIGGDSSTTGHPTTCLSVLSGLLGRAVGNKEKSTEDLKIPPSPGFLQEIVITGSFTVAITYVIMYYILTANDYNPTQVWEYAEGKTGIFTYISTHAIYFGAGITIVLQGVHMLIAEIVPIFKGIADEFVPNATPALNVPVIFPYAPDTLMIGFLVVMVTSITTIPLTAGMFPTAVIPLVSAYFFEIGHVAVVGNVAGEVQGCMIGAVAPGITMIFLVGSDFYLFNNMIQQWILVYEGQDFSLQGIIEGLIARLIG